MKYRPGPFAGASAGSSTSMYRHSRPIFSMLPSAFSSIVVRPPAMLPLVGCDVGEVVGLVRLDHVVLVGLSNMLYHLSPTSGVAARALRRCARAPVISDVSPKTAVDARADQLVEHVADGRAGRRARWSCRTRRTWWRPTVPSMSHSSRCSSDAHCTNSLAVARGLGDGRRCRRGPRSRSRPPACRSWRCPRRRAAVQPSSMPITTTAATLGLEPVPISVRKCRSRSSPNCSRP